MNRDLYLDDYKKLIVPFAQTKPRISIDDRKISHIRELVSEIVNAKLPESHHKCDNGSEYKRLYIGLLGEAAMER